MRRLGIVALAAVLAAGVALCLAVIVKAAILEHDVDFEPAYEIPSPVTEPALVNATEVTFAGYDSLPAAGIFLPSRNGRFVVLVHGAGSGRRQLLSEASVFAAHGYGFLSIDLPGHGKSLGPIEWGNPEKQLVKQALTWARRQSDDCTAFGLYGFSMGTWMGLLAAVEAPQVQALAMAGCFADIRDVFTAQAGRWGALGYFGTIAEARRMNYHYDLSPPIELIKAYAPRPVLFVVGSDDAIAPAASCRKLYQAASGEKQWLTVEGAGHGRYLEAQPERVGMALISFFDDHLTPRRSCKR